MVQFDFTGQVVAITGASFGIGQATALAFGRSGAKLALADNVTNQAFLDQLNQENIPYLFQKTDVRSKSDQMSFFEALRIRFGRLDVVFINAGIEGQPGNFLDTHEDAWEKTMDINLEGARLSLKHSLNLMLPQGKGAVVLCASIAGLVGFQQSAAYVASKHALVGLTKTVAMEYASQGIQINAVCPGIIQTPMIDRFSGGNMDVLAPMIARKAIGRIGKPEEVANLVQFLASPQSAFVVGQAIAIDGGYTLG